MQEKEARIKPFIATRSQHLKESAEDYTELIADLIQEKGVARTCEIAKYMNISHVTALRCIKRLQRDGYLETSPHKPIVLTEKGRLLAKEAKEKHTILLKFLIKLGIPEDVAAIDAEGIEHHLSPETLDAFKKFLNI